MGDRMNQVIVKYKVKNGRAEENQKLVEAVYAELGRTKPAGLRYATFMAEDGLTFYHVASIESNDEVNPLGKNKAFAEFQENIKERCDEPPMPVNVSMVGSYRFFA